MRAVIIGAGDVGAYASKILSEQGVEVTLIDYNQERCSAIDEEQNVKVICANGASAKVLFDSGCGDVDFFISLTISDQTNLIACSLAKALGAREVIARIHDQGYSDYSYINYQLHFNIDLLVNPEQLCAVELAKYIRNPSRVAVENFSRGKIEVQQITLDKKCKDLGKPLKQVLIPEGVRVAYIQNKDEFEVATGETILSEGDSVTLVGSHAKITEIKDQWIRDKSQEEDKNIVIYGATETAIALVGLLSNPRYKIRIIEKDKDVCLRLAKQFPKITIIQGDATSLRLLEEEHVGGCDYFVSCTKDDEDNVMTSLQAHKLGVEHVHLVINSPDYEDLLHELKDTMGVEHVVSPRLSTMKELRHVVSPKKWSVLSTLCDGQAKVVEVCVSLDSECAGKHINEIVWPYGVVIVSIMHKFQAKVPVPTDRILGGDRLIIITRSDQADEIIKMFVG